ncbi:threonine-phosphate decarboxylase [Clostridium acetireducens DSM 10703]|uniref:Threonine-phosphate decarboxylase n=1 Tax=Clostridium acetireducens DSM 10703 TaxID=1121290 RepID=A0A1E8EZV4_9CLOT|nr:histidinol-phosphate transaminase [Clostridium acetireducens]OFI06698.1 threonine-phosphate decarboxylase [Clostridium acetireducens DSM 10703]
MEHGGDIYTEGILKGKTLLDFSSNINQLKLPQGFKECINKALDNVYVYPDIQYRSLRKNILDYLNFSINYFYKTKGNSLKNISEENIVLGNGAAEIIDEVIACFKSICIAVPSFIEYEKNALKHSLKITYSYLDENMNLNYDDIKEKLKYVEALFVANPNNPNGQIIDKSNFKAILDYCEKNNKTVIIDEAFIEFTGRNSFSFLNELDNYKCIFIIKALTKFYCIPGIRLGYGVSGNTSIISKIKENQNPWNINCFAEAAAEYLLKDKDFINRSLEEVEKERKYLLNELENIDFIEKVYKTYSNFVLCKTKYECDYLYDVLLEKGVIIRKADNFKGLNKYYVRVAIKDREKNKAFINCLKELDKSLKERI